MQTFAERFKEAMQGRGQNEFGTLIGLSKGRVSQILSGGGQIGADAAFRLEDKTGYRARWVVLGELPKRSIEMNGGETEKLLTRLREAVIVKVEEAFAAVRGSPQGKKRGDTLILDLGRQSGGSGKRHPAKTRPKQKSNKGAAGSAA